MSASTETLARPSAEPEAELDFDVIVIGAGMSGMYQLYRLREQGLRVRVFEAGTGVGGTWYWNRYPGARFDSESYSYAFSFSDELLEEWDWAEHFSPQPHTLAYLNHVADKFDLRRDIQFEARVKAAHWLEDARAWEVTLEDGGVHRARFLVAAVGPLSAPTWPKIDGLHDFVGELYHTGLWPKEPVTFAGKRVAVIGTGATGVQTIQEVAKTAGHLTVFQRRPNWCAPLHNSRIGPDEQPGLKARYPEIFRRCQETQACFLHHPDPRRTMDVPEAEREAFWENLYSNRGFGMWQGNFIDMLTDRAANAAVSDFVARKIRARVKDPATAEKLIPKDHGFGTRRVPLETKYYEVYNQDNVELVDVIHDEPIERITATGLKTAVREREFDMIICATGFDAITGSFDRIDIRGRGGETLKDKWRRGIETFLGVMVEGYPNMFMLVGPHTALGNIPRSIEYNVEWIDDAIRFLTEKGLTYAEPKREAIEAWTGFVAEKAEGLLSNEVDSWMTGINRNVEGKQTRTLARYSGSAADYRKRANATKAGGYKELKLE